MRIILVGDVRVREQLRRAIAGASVEVVGEAASIAAARSLRGADAWVTVSAAERPGGAPGVITDPRLQTGLDPDPLTSREIDVLNLLAHGLPNKSIAARLGISDQTVKFHLASISGKLGARNRTDVVRLAIRRGLVTV
jgi:DNA-binding CsgD family transcriptional regulator